MAIGPGGSGRVSSPYIQRLAQRMKVQGQGSLTAGAADAAQKAPPKPGFHPLQVLKNYEPGKLLSGKEMREYARALSVAETRPAIHGYKGLIKEGEKAKGEEVAGLGKLGERTAGNVTGVYGTLATSGADALARQTALGNQLTAGSAAIAKAGGAELTANQTGALGDYEKQLQMRGAPAGGGAQEALAQAVASQQATQNTDSQAAQQFAGSQAANSASLASAMAGSAQMQGGQAVGNINRDIVNRTGEANQKYDQNINGLREKLGEAKAAYGTSFAKNLLGVRGEERKFLLGKQAVAGEKTKLGLEGKKLTAEQEQNEIANRIAQQNANSSATSAAASALNATTNAWEAKHPGASSGEAAKYRKETKANILDIHSLLPQATAAIAPNERDNLPTYQAYIQKSLGKTVSPALIQKVLKQWFAAKAISHPPGTF